METNVNSNSFNLKLKKTSNKSNYIIFNNDKLINFKLSNVFLKFGIEYYNNKKILNIFIDTEKSENNNEYNNKIELLNTINKIKDIKENKFLLIYMPSWIDKDIKKKIMNKK